MYSLHLAGRGSFSSWPWLIGVSFGAVFVAAVRADTTLDSGTVTIGTGTNLGATLYVGSTGTATMKVVTGANVTTARAVLGRLPGSRGTATMMGGTWTNAGDLMVGASGTGTLVISGGSLTVGGILTQGAGGSIGLGAGGTLQIGTGGTSGDLAISSLINDGQLVFNRSGVATYAGHVGGAGAIMKQGPGWLSLVAANAFTGSTTIQQGTLQLGHAAALAASEVSPLAGGTLAVAPSLQATIGGLRPGAGGMVDVGTGMITVAGGLSREDLLSALEAGRGDGSWNGAAGIGSSALSDGDVRTVGWRDNGDGSMAFGFAAPGDANLDWVVDVLDLAEVAGGGGFNSGAIAVWSEGDFNGDRFFDILDAADFVSSGLYNAGAYAIPAVPEPSLPALAGVGVALLGARAARRRAGA